MSEFSRLAEYIRSLFEIDASVHFAIRPRQLALIAAAHFWQPRVFLAEGGKSAVKQCIFVPQGQLANIYVRERCKTRTLWLGVGMNSGYIGLQGSQKISS